MNKYAIKRNGKIMGICNINTDFIKKLAAYSVVLGIAFTTLNGCEKTNTDSDNIAISTEVDSNDDLNSEVVDFISTKPANFFYENELIDYGNIIPYEVENGDSLETLVKTYCNYSPDLLVEYEDDIKRYNDIDYLVADKEIYLTHVSQETLNEFGYTNDISLYPEGELFSQRMEFFSKIIKYLKSEIYSSYNHNNSLKNKYFDLYKDIDELESSYIDNNCIFTNAMNEYSKILEDNVKDLTGYDFYNYIKPISIEYSYSNSGVSKK